MRKAKPITYKKLLLKIWDDNTIRWEHLCYVPAEVHAEYFARFPDKEDFRENLLEWCKEDFGESLKLNTRNDLFQFRRYVTFRYARQFKVKQLNSRSCWFRYWLTNRMLLEVEENEY